MWDFVVDEEKANKYKASINVKEGERNMLDDIMDDDQEEVRESIISVGVNKEHEELRQRFSASIHQKFVPPIVT